MTDCICPICIESRALWVPEQCYRAAVSAETWHWESCMRLMQRPAAESRAAMPRHLGYICSFPAADLPLYQAAVAQYDGLYIDGLGLHAQDPWRDLTAFWNMFERLEAEVIG